MAVRKVTTMMVAGATIAVLVSCPGVPKVKVPVEKPVFSQFVLC